MYKIILHYSNTHYLNIRTVLSFNAYYSSGSLAFFFLSWRVTLNANKRL